ncbi:hypothetical protein [Mycobacterium simiae]|uniref:hypothetical protein n=1 Tax=Mycobacterium simiae TaxID=1784 RepID=UPI00041DA972|nr:hypothetical protein [Mycobacterium simiae]PLV52137.1 hypothetical protein X011_09015 [Mycobacterium tuberculosis variant microti OV254]BBX43875.1 hypothetical protein MSIM_53260 [Mycobacterium simiae]
MSASHPSKRARLLQALADSTSIAMENVRVCAELEQRVRDRTAARQQANRGDSSARRDRRDDRADEPARLLSAGRAKATGSTSQRPYRLAASIGAVRAPAHGAGATVDELLIRADELMYDEKKTSGNTRA